MGFPKIDKGTMITIFFFDFQIFGIKTSMLTNFRVHPTIFYRNYGPLFMEPILAKMTSFWPKMTSQRRRGEIGLKSLKIAMQTWFMGIYMNINSKTPYNIQFPRKNGGGSHPPMSGRHAKGPCEVGLIIQYCDFLATQHY